MARTHTIGGVAKRAGGAGLRLVLGKCQSTAFTWTTTASKVAAQLRQAVRVYAPLSADTARSVTGRAWEGNFPKIPVMSLKDN